MNRRTLLSMIPTALMPSFLLAKSSSHVPTAKDVPHDIAPAPLAPPLKPRKKWPMYFWSLDLFAMGDIESNQNLYNRCSGRAAVKATNRSERVDPVRAAESAMGAIHNLFWPANPEKGWPITGLANNTRLNARITMHHFGENSVEHDCYQSYHFVGMTMAGFLKALRRHEVCQHLRDGYKAGVFQDTVVYSADLLNRNDQVLKDVGDIVAASMFHVPHVRV